MPSTWEEAYGYAGVEFLAKGIPLIANAIGGMTDYTRDGETGWLNRSLGAAELAGIMRGLAREPARVRAMSSSVLAHRDELVIPLARHAESMDTLYCDVVSSRRASIAAR
jgi:glycosyltransferase involved in cell wall biosynthesis